MKLRLPTPLVVSLPLSRSLGVWGLALVCWLAAIFLCAAFPNEPTTLALNNPEPSAQTPMGAANGIKGVRFVEPLADDVLPVGNDRIGGEPQKQARYIGGGSQGVGNVFQIVLFREVGVNCRRLVVGQSLIALEYVMAVRFYC